MTKPLDEPDTDAVKEIKKALQNDFPKGTSDSAQIAVLRKAVIDLLTVLSGE